MIEDAKKDEEETDGDSIGFDYALVGELEIKASEDRVRFRLWRLFFDEHKPLRRHQGR